MILLTIPALSMLNSFEVRLRKENVASLCIE